MRESFEFSTLNFLASTALFFCPRSGQKNWYAFLQRSTRDAEEVPAVRCGEAAVAFGDVGGDRERSAVELVGKETVTARDRFGSRADLVCEFDGLLVDDEFF